MVSIATQTTYPGNPRAGAAGMPADASTRISDTAAAGEAGIKAGTFLVYCVANANRKQVRNPQVNRLTLLQSGDFASGKTYAGTLRITNLDGTYTDYAISQGFTTDHATSADALLAAFNGITGITAVFTDGSTKRSIRLTVAGDKSLSSPVDFTLTGLTVTETQASTDVICGVAGIDETTERATDETVSYGLGASVPIMRFGKVFMDAETAMALSDTVYARIDAGASTFQGRGYLRNAAGSSPVVAIAVAGNVKVFTPTSAAAQTAVVELNLIGAA